MDKISVSELFAKYTEQTSNANAFADGEINAKSGCDDCVNICDCCANGCLCMSICSNGDCC